MPDAPAAAAPWTCDHCRAPQTHELWCELCHEPRYRTFAIQFAHHIVEHLADGVTEPLAMLEAMQARPCYARTTFTLSQIVAQMRMLTKDTRKLAEQIVQAQSARLMIRACASPDPKDQIAILKQWGPKANPEEHNVNGQTIVKHVYETVTDTKTNPA